MRIPTWQDIEFHAIQGDREYDELVEQQLRIDAGARCPTCRREIPFPLREFPLGIATFRCTACKSAWFDLTKGE